MRLDTDYPIRYTSYIVNSHHIQQYPKDLLKISPPIQLNEYLEYMGSPRAAWASGESGGISRLNVDEVNGQCDLIAEREGEGDMNKFLKFLL